MTSKILRLGGVEFTFLFSFSPDDPLLSPPSSVPDQPASSPPMPYLEVLFYSQGYPNDYFHWAGTLTSDQIPFEIPGANAPQTSPPYPGNAQCQGNFWLYTNTYTGDSFVWFDINYGPEYEGEYEGAMVQIPGDDQNA